MKFTGPSDEFKMFFFKARRVSLVFINLALSNKLFESFSITQNCNKNILLCQPPKCPLYGETNGKLL